MTRKQHLYIFLNKNEFKDYEISSNLVLKYMNQFVIQEEAQIEVIEIHQLQKVFKNGSHLSENVKRAIVEAIQTARSLDDGETDHHFIFGRYNDLLAEYLNDIGTFIKAKYPLELLYPLLKMHDEIWEEANSLIKFINVILNSYEMVPNTIRVTWMSGIRLCLTCEAMDPAKINDLFSFVLRNNYIFLELSAFDEFDVDSLKISILGDDVEKFFNEIKHGDFVTGGNAFYFHQMMNNEETKKIKSSDEVFLKDFAKTLYKGKIPEFDKDDQLFVEILCTRLTFTVRK